MTLIREKSPWFAPDQAPWQEGVYEVEERVWTSTTHGYARWSQAWGWGDVHTRLLNVPAQPGPRTSVRFCIVRWRGLATDPASN